MQWQAVIGAVSYSIQLADNPSFTNPRNYTGKIGNKFTVKDLGYNQTYYWRVNSSNLLFNSDWSNSWSFQTVATPPAPVNIVYNIAVDWNMLSIPNLISDYSPAVVWTQPPRSSEVFIYDGGYVVVSQTENGPGYWVKFSNSWQKTYIGNPISLLPVSVKKGWNIIGSISEKIHKNKIIKEPDNLSYGIIFRFVNGGYVATDTLYPGSGHWIKVNMDGQLVLNSNASGNSITPPSRDILDEFIITDSEGNSQSLFISNAEVSPELVNSDMLMPPSPPFVHFDARFESGEYIKTVDPNTGVVELSIIVRTENYPITISWDINPENALTYSVSFIPEGGLGKSQSHKILTSGNLLVPKIKGGIISLKTEKDKSLEKSLTYSLGDNYPNPFNPKTRISYALPEPSFVTLKIFDVLGREVATLVNEFKDAGYYEISFDASAHPSGVYFYKLQAGNFTSVKKMLLMK